MTVDVRVPELGTPHATLSVRHVQAGERVAEGDRVAELLIPGAVIDVDAPADGVLRVWVVSVGEGVVSGQSLAVVEVES